MQDDHVNGGGILPMKLHVVVAPMRHLSMFLYIFQSVFVPIWQSFDVRCEATDSELCW